MASKHPIWGIHHKIKFADWGFTDQEEQAILNEGVVRAILFLSEKDLPSRTMPDYEIQVAVEKLIARWMNEGL